MLVLKYYILPRSLYCRLYLQRRESNIDIENKDLPDHDLYFRIDYDRWFTLNDEYSAATLPLEISS